jgi:predicted transcriptional regulator
MARSSATRFELRGDLQVEIMAAVWSLGEATVDDVRALQRKDRRSAYTTVQTVMNRLVERGLLERERRGRGFVYRARLDEATQLSRALQDRLAAASPEVRRAALHDLVGGLDGEDLDEVARYARRIRRERDRGR